MNIADRVNLGLIPSSEPGWKPACKALKSCSGGILHIHGNVESKVKNKPPCTSERTPHPHGSDNINYKHEEWRIWCEETSVRIRRILHEIHNKEWDVTIVNLVVVKSYAPHIHHLVLDLQCKPP